MATTQTTDLIIHPNPSSKDYQKGWNAAGTSVFGRFISALMAEHGKHQRLAIGVELVAFPVLEAVVAGLAIISQKVAAKLSIQLTTETNWEDVANRVNRIVSFGLILEHGTPEDAAKAFVATVVQPVLTGVVIPREPQGLYQFFFNTSGHFFAGCVSATTRVRRELEDLYTQIEQHNLLGSVTIMEEVQSDNIPRITLEMDPTQDYKPNIDAVETVTMAKRVLDSVRRDVVGQQALRALPLHFGDIPEEVVGYNRSVYPSWVNTQLFLAALDAHPKEGHLQADDYPRAVETFLALSNQEVMDRFWDRMERRGLRGLDRSKRQALEGLLVERMGDLRTYELDLASTLQKVFVDMTRARQVHFSHEVALGYLIDPNQVKVITHDPTPDQLFMAVDWQQVSADQVKAMLKNFDVPFEVVAKGITLMPTNERQEAVTAFLSKAETKPYRRPLFEARLVPLTVKFVAQHKTEVPEEDLEAHLPSLLKETAAMDDDDLPGQLGAELVRLGERLETAISSPEHRWNFVRGIMDRALLNPIQIRVKAEDLRPCFKKATWERLTLAVIVLICSPKSMDGGNAYQERKDRLPYGDFPPWTGRFQNGQEPLGWCSAMDCTAEEGRRLIETYSEEEIFRWLYEHRGAELNQMWREYATERDQFHDYWSNQPE